MQWDAAIWAGSTAFSAKLAAACAVAATLLLAIDARQSAIGWRVMLNLAAITAGVWTSLNCVDHTMWTWQALIALSTLALLVAIAQWMTVAPTEIHREAAQVDKIATKQARNSIGPQVAKSSYFWLPSAPNEWIQVLAGKLTPLFVGWSIYSASSGTALTRWTCVLHAMMTIVALGISLVIVIEMTFISSPSGSSSANWKRLSFLALLVWIGELFCVSQLLFWMDEPSRDLNNSLLVFVFAITAVVVNFIVWMIPYRLTQFAKKGTTSDWISLTIAAWTVTLCLALAALLPFNWPWTLYSYSTPSFCTACDRRLDLAETSNAEKWKKSLAEL
jgi:hypothetical protein